MHRQLLAAYWLTRAPRLPGWTFYSARQPSADPGKLRLTLGGDKFEAEALWLTPLVDAQHERIHLTVWHPLFPKLDDRARWTVTFLLLDEAFGEIGTQNWIGRIEMNDSQLNGAIPLGELRPFAERAQSEHAWKKGEPGEIWSIYSFEEEYADRPRGDVYVVKTCATALIGDFGKAAGKLPDPLAGTGADYVYVALEAGILPNGKEADGRAEFEDALASVLEPAASGRLLGGAMGRRLAYIDLLLYDGSVSVGLVLETLRKLRLPSGTSVNYFAHEKRGHRVVL